jgi:DNA-binding XRE family transcriptional regulator
MPSFTEIKQTVGVMLRQERERLGKTQGVVAEKIGVNESTYCRWEGGQVVERMGPYWSGLVKTFGDQVHKWRKMLAAAALEEEAHLSAERARVAEALAALLREQLANAPDAPAVSPSDAELAKAMGLDPDAADYATLSHIGAIGRGMAAPFMP